MSPSRFADSVDLDFPAVSVLGKRNGDDCQSMRLPTMFEARFPGPGRSQAGQTRGLAAFSNRY
jgi:hypothetical protein